MSSDGRLLILYLLFLLNFTHIYTYILYVVFEIYYRCVERIGRQTMASAVTRKEKRILKNVPFKVTAIQREGSPVLHLFMWGMSNR